MMINNTRELAMKIDNDSKAISIIANLKKCLSPEYKDYCKAWSIHEPQTDMEACLQASLTRIFKVLKRNGIIDTE